jgi:hypothetical protein
MCHLFSSSRVLRLFARRSRVLSCCFVRRAHRFRTLRALSCAVNSPRLESNILIKLFI